MHKHADSQVGDAEATRLLVAALNDSATAGSLELVRARAITQTEMVGLWTLSTPDGPLHRVAAVPVVGGGDPLWECLYRDLADAEAVWSDLVEARAEAKARPSGV